VTRFTVITDTANDEKMLIAGLGCLPTAAIVDYELTLSMPYRLIADTGIDALTHAIEAFVSKRATAVSDGYALAAMARIWRHLRQACADPADREARAAMMLGATEAGLAFSNASVALVHGMSRPIGAFFHVPHGLSNAMLLPLVTAFSVSAAGERYARCARAMGLADDGDADDLAVDRLLDALTALNRDLSVPTPQAYGIDRARYEGLVATMAAQALASGSPGNNPRVPTETEIIELYRRAYA
jgi:alcohol dehydrogenase class IV